MMKKSLLTLIMMLLILAGPAFADTSYSGTLSAAGTTCATSGACVQFDRISDNGVMGVQLSGTFTATVQFEGTMDGDNWVSLTAIVPGTLSTATSATAAGAWQVNTGAMKSVRVRCSAYTSGTITVQMNFAKASPNNAAGSASVTGTVDTNILEYNSGAVDGTGLPVKAGSGGLDAQMQDGSGNALTSATRGSEQALSVQLVDGSGTQITTFGGGTQYTEGDTDATITGTVLMIEASADTIGAVGTANVLPVGDASGSLTVDDGGSPISVDDNGSSLSVDDGGSTISIDGTLTSITNVVHVDDNSSTLSIDDGASTISIDGTLTGITNVVHVDDNSGDLSIDDGGNVITVDGTVAATQSGTWNSQTQDGSGNALTSASRGSERALSVQVVDSSGNQITSFGGSGGTAMNDDSAFTVGTTSTTPVAGIYRSSRDTVDDNDAGALAMNASRGLYVTLEESDATATGVAGNPLEVSLENTASNTNALLVTGTGGTFPISGTLTDITNTISVDDASSTLSIDDNSSSISVDDGGVALEVDNAGTFVVQASAYDGSGTANDATHPIYTRLVTSTGAQADDSAIDSAINAGENPVFVGGEYEASRTAIEDGDKGGLHFTTDQLLLTTTIDPCSDTASTTLAVSQADDAQLVAASGSTKIYVCSAVLVGAAAEIINFIEGTGSVCGTSTLAVVGSTTQGNGMSFAANGGFTAGNGAASAFHTNTGGNALCLTQNGTSRVSGYITYVQK